MYASINTCVIVIASFEGRVCLIRTFIHFFRISYMTLGDSNFSITITSDVDQMKTQIALHWF